MIDFTSEEKLDAIENKIDKMMNNHFVHVNASFDKLIEETLAMSRSISSMIKILEERLPLNDK